MTNSRKSPRFEISLSQFAQLYPKEMNYGEHAMCYHCRKDGKKESHQTTSSMVISPAFSSQKMGRDALLNPLIIIKLLPFPFKEIVVVVKTTIPRASCGSRSRLLVSRLSSTRCKQQFIPVKERIQIKFLLLGSSSNRDREENRNIASIIKDVESFQVVWGWIGSMVP